MGRYVIRRLLQMIPVFFGVTFIMYFLMFPLGDPIANLAAGKQKNPAYEAFLTKEFNLDDPFIVQYLKYLQGIFTGDLGSTFFGKPVTELFVERWPVTLKLGLTAFAIEIVLGIALGIIAARRKGGVLDQSFLASTLVVISIPIFVTRLRRAVRVRRQARVVSPGGHRRWLAHELHPAGLRAGLGVVGLRPETHALQAP